MSGMKSYTRSEILAAYARGQEVFALDTGDDGGDDVIIGTEDECWDQVSDFLAQDGLEIPEYYSLRAIARDEFEERFCP